MPQASPSPATQRDAGVLALAAFVCLMPVLCVFAPVPVALVGPLFAVGWLLARRDELKSGSGHDIAWLLLAIGLWGGISAAWALDGGLALQQSAAFLAATVPLTWLCASVPEQTASRAFLTRATLTGLLLAAVLLALQTTGGFLLRSVMPGAAAPAVAPFKLNVSIAALALGCWVIPQAVVGLPRPWQVAGGAALLLIGLAVFRGDGSASRLGFLLGGAIWLGTLTLPRLTLAGLFTGVLLVHLAAPRLAEYPEVTQRVTEASWQHRLDLWQLTGRLSAERPLLGYGLANSSRIPARSRPLPLTHLPARLPLYPHNVLLQAQLELGVPGLIAFYGLLALLLRRIWLRPPLARASAAACLGAALGVWLVGYPLWRGPWVAWLCVVALTWVLTTPVEPRGARLA